MVILPSSAHDEPEPNTRSTMAPSMQQQPFRASVVQAAPVLGETSQTIEKVAALTADAAREGAKLVVFPEAFIGGYPKGQQFGISLGIRTAEGRDEFRRYFDGAIEIT